MHERDQSNPPMGGHKDSRRRLGRLHPYSACKLPLRGWSARRGNMDEAHVLCPLIMTPPPMTLHVIGNIFRSGLSSALDPDSEGDCEE